MEQPLSKNTYLHNMKSRQSLPELISKPPVTNRGVVLPKPSETGIDWFTASFDRARLEVIRSVLDFWLSEDGLSDYVPHYPRLDSGVKWTCGARLHWGADEQWGVVILPGAVADFLGVQDYSGLVHSLLEARVKCTRIDLFIDDFQKRVHPRVMKEWSDRGDLCRFQKYSYIESGKDGCDGASYYAGKRGSSGSGCFFRCYDKSVAPSDKADCYRMEWEFTGSKAVEVCRTLSENGSKGLVHWSEVVWSLCVGAIDFRDRSEGMRLDRSERLPEWSAVIGSSAGVRVSKKRNRKCLSNTISAFCKQWGGFLASLCESGPSPLLRVIAGAVKVGKARGFGVVMGRGTTKLSSVVRSAKQSGEWAVRFGLSLGAESKLSSLDRAFQLAMDLTPS